MIRDNKVEIKTQDDFANIDKNLSDLSYKVYGSDANTVPTDIDKKLSSLTNELDINCSGDILGSLTEIIRDSNTSDVVKFEKLKSTIQDSRNSGIVQSLFSEMSSVVAKYEDLIVITSIMPQLKDARKGIVSNILSPDDATKRLALSINVNGEPIGNKDEYKVLNGTIKEIMKEVEFTKLLKHTVDRTVTLGKYACAVIPYSELYGKIIQKNENEKKGMGRLSENTKILNESDVSIYNEDEFKENLDTKITPLKSVKTSMVDFVNNNVTINDGADGLFDDELLMEEIKLKIESDNTDFEKSAMKMMNGNKGNKSSNLQNFDNGFFDVDSVDPNNVPKIMGCKIKKLDPRKTIPLKIDDTILGYYYIESKESVKALQSPVKFKFKSDMSSKDMNDNIDGIYKTLGELMVKKIDKKFIEKNNVVKDRLYDIIKYYEDSKQTYNITFLKPDQVVEFEVDNGESPFEQSLFFSKLYMLVLMSTITARVTRSNDIRAYYVDVDAQGPANSMVMNAVNTLKRQNKSIMYYNNIQKVMSSSTVFDDIFLPRSAESGKTPIDFDIIQGQNVDIPTDLLEMLEKICVDTTGLPLQLIQSSNDADFAKTYSMLNMKFLKNIVDLQVDINPSVTELLVKILLTYFEKDSDDYAIIKSIEANLQSPINVQLSNSLEQMNNAKEYATTVAELKLGSSNENDKLLDALVLALTKMHTPNVDWDAIDTVTDNIMNDLKENDIKADDAVGDDDVDMSEL